MGLEPHYGSPPGPNRLPGFLLAPDRHHKTANATASWPRYAHFALQKNGVDDGTRTHDDRHHKPGLYQLSYAHHYIQIILQFCTSLVLTGREPGAPGRTRTCNPRLRRPVLYPVELRAQSLCILFYACHSQLAAFHAARCSPRRCAPLPRPLACRLAAFGRAKATLSLLTALTQLSYGRNLCAFYSTPAIPNWQRFTLLGARLVAALLCPGHSPAGSRRSVGRKQCFRC